MANDAAIAPRVVEFRKSHPIDFSLLDKDEQAVMYISEDENDWELHLTIANTSSQSITLKDSPVKQTTLPNHHFALRFRAGTLSQQTLTLLTTNFSKFAQPTDWQIAQLAQKPVGNTQVILYLRYTGANKDLSQTAPYSLKLTGFTAAPGSGSRGTQVELIPNPAQVVFTADNNGVTGSRTQYLHVTNHSGRKVIPLHVGLVGKDQVMTGAEENLILRITNIVRVKKDSNDSGKIKFNGNPANGPHSVLVLSYDRGDTEWELGTSIKSVNVLNSKKEITCKGEPDKNAPEWVMTFTTEVLLGYGESIDIEIKGIVVSSQAGHANLYLHYDNIPGYWDGQFVCTVEKGAILNGAGMVKMGFANNRDLWFRDDVYHTPVDKDPGGIHVFGNYSELKFSAGYVGTEQHAAPLKQVSLVTDKAAVTGELTASALTVTTDEGKLALNVTGQTIMNFGTNGGLMFRGNNNGNPAIMTQRATAGLTICAENGGKIPELILNAETIKSGETLVVKNLAIEGQVAGFQPMIFEGVGFYFVREDTPKNGRIEGHTMDSPQGPVEKEFIFPQPVAKAMAFLGSYHLEFVTSAASSDRKERPLSLIGAGAEAVIDPGNPKRVIVTAWAALSDDQKSVTDPFEGSAQVVVLVSFHHAI